MRGIRASLLGLAFLAVAGKTSTAVAQGAQDPVTVRTFMLQRLSQQQAADLLAPYMSAGKGEGVFTAGTGVRGVTVRGTRATLTRVDSLLRANDRAARLVRLRFQLITTSDTALGTDPEIADVDAALRGLFRFKGYRLLSEGVIQVAEGAQSFSLYLNGGGDGERYAVGGDVGSIAAVGGEEAARIRVHLVRPSPEGVGVYLLDTDLTAAFGKTIVLGSSVRGAGSVGTMILTVRPDHP